MSSANFVNGLLRMAGRPEEAIAKFETAYRLSPHDGNAWAFFGMRAAAYVELGQYDRAIECARIAINKPNAKYWAYSYLAAGLGYVGPKAEAQSAVADLLARKSDFSISFVREHLYYYRNPEQRERYLDGLRKAGLPE